MRMFSKCLCQVGPHEAGSGQGGDQHGSAEREKEEQGKETIHCEGIGFVKKPISFSLIGKGLVQ